MFPRGLGHTLAPAREAISKWARLAEPSSLLSAVGTLLLGATLALTTGCGDEDSPKACEKPADVAGDYTVSLTNVHNTCPTMAESWTDGAMNEGVDFLIEQRCTTLSAETMGDPALYFLLLLGANDFKGELDDSHFVLTNHGTKEYTYESCDYTIDAVVEGDLDGDSISGTLTYTPVIKPSADCMGYECAAEQTFTGVRPHT